ncbi:hypothetical protein IW18_01190 [Flavobacterium hibernum]|uniref:Uncharacterized protein n=1 Tax=Flavobacterium hibernum TaxID=37752 RepID=A0A0D0EFT2_9FLAO|nr:hypothetical protein IW18_01190 [Flavobacterium hibernum]
MPFEHRKYGRPEIDLRALLIHLAAGRFGHIDDKGGDMVVGNVYLILSCAAGAVVGNDNEDGILVPGLFRRLGKEPFQGIVGILDSPLASRSRRDVYPARRIGVGPMVGGGHHEIQERLSLLMLLVGSA